MGTLLPMPLLKAIAYFLSIVATVVPQLVPAALHPHLAEQEGASDDGTFVPIPLDDGGDETFHVAPVETNETAEPEPEEAPPAEPAPEAPPANETPAEFVRPKPPPPPFSARWSAEGSEVAPGGAVPLTLTLASQYEWHLSVAIVLREVTAGWSGRVSESRIDLAPGEALEIPVTLAAPTTAKPGDVGRLRVELSTYQPAHVESYVATAAVPLPEVVRGVHLTSSATSRYVAPGESATYSITVVNSGSEPDTFHLEVPAGSDGWTATLSTASLTLEPNEARGVDLVVAAPGDAADGEGAYFNVTARSAGDPSVARSASTLTVVDGENGGLPVDLDVVCVNLVPPADSLRETDAYERVCVDLRFLRGGSSGQAEE